MVCVTSTCRFGIKYNRYRFPWVSSGWYVIIDPIPDRLVDLLITRGLKGIFRNFGWDLVPVVGAYLRIYAIDFGHIRKKKDLRFGNRKSLTRKRGARS